MTSEERRKLLAVIHLNKKQAALSDADYRAILMEVVGVESAGSCNEQQLLKLADHFKSFCASAKRNRDDNYYHIAQGLPFWKQKRFVAALWVELGYRASGLDTRAQKQFGAKDFTMLTDKDLQTLGRDLTKRLSRKKKGSANGKHGS